MAGVIQKPDNLSLSGNIKKFILSGNQPVSFILKKEGTVLLESEYIPGADNLLEIDVRDVVENCLSYKLDTSSDSYTQTDLVASFTATIDGTDYPFCVIRGGVSNLADTASNWLKLHFLTWQPRIKTVTYYSPEWLTYYAVEGCSIQLKATYPDKTIRVITLHSCSAGTAVTLNMQYAVIAGMLGSTYPSSYEVWAESGGAKLSESQVYAFSDVLSEDEQWYLFENSLGGLDTFRAYGTNNLNAEHEHNIAEFSDIREEYEVDTNRKYTKNTGYLDEYSRRWLLDFFPSRAKYVYDSTTIRKIVVTESNVTYISNEIPSSYTFTWQLAEVSPYLNLIKNENDIPDNLVAPDLSSPDFILPPRLAELPRVSLSEGVLIPAFDPFNPKPSVTTYGAIHNTIKNAVVKELENEIGNISGGGSGSDLEIIESTDTTTVPSETNVYSALLSKKEDSKRLRKDVADTASKLITFMEGLVSRMKAVLESGADFGVDGSGGHIEATGEAEFLNLFLREYLKTDKIQSQEFHAGALGTGFLIKRDPVTGKSYAEVDELFVRIKAFFTELEIKKLSYAGGNWIFSAAGMKCVRVEDKGAYYRCYFTASDGETTVKNEFRVDDLCRSQEFNVKVGTSQNASSRYYWRLCVAVGDDYIDLSKTDCDTNSDAPLAGDSIVQLGNRTDVARQNAILISAYGEGSPSITQHTGIKSYSLLGTEKTRISPELNEFTGEFHFTTGENVKDEVDGAKADAAAADSKAVAAQGTATAAKNRLDSWASDGVISPTEKVALKTEQTDIRAEKTEIVADAVKYNVSATAYVNAYTAYDSDLTYHTYASPENITILPTFATRQTAYYSARTVILAAIATAAKSYVDTGVGSAKSYTDTTFSAVDGKITLAVDSVKVGGRNLIINSKEVTQPATSSNWNFAAHEITQIKPDTIYILSVDKSVINSGPGASAFSVLIYDLKIGMTMAPSAVPISTDRQIIKLQTPPDLNVNNSFQLLFYTGPAGAAANRGMSFYNVKLEEGNKATVWSPAPEDQNAYADQAANTVRTETNTKLEVIDGKISQTVTKTEYNSGINKLELASLIASGKMIHTDPSFKEGSNGIVVYGTNVTIVREALNTAPNDSGYVLKITTSAQSSIGLGGWAFMDLAAYNRVYVVRFVANIPTGYELNHSSNQLGNNAVRLWLSDNKGTGKWQEYSYYVRYGDSGTLGSTNFFYLTGGNGTLPVTWYLAYATTYMIGSYESYPTKTEYKSEIKQLSDRIDLGVTKTEFNNLQIGGRNYIVGNKTYLDHEYHNVSVSNVILQRLSNGEAFTFSMRVNAKNMTAQRNELYLQLKDSNNEITQLSFPFNLSGNYTSKHIISTISVIAKSYTSINAAMLITLGTSAGVQCYDLKLEEGNKATDYSPSPEDLENYVIDNYTSKTTYQSGISVLSDQINLRATRESVTALDTRITQAEIKLQPDNIWLGISDKTLAATRKLVDLTGLNQSTYYPVTIWTGNTISDIVSITVSRPLSSYYGVPAWSTHIQGFSLTCKWDTTASGWGSADVKRRIKEYTASHLQSGIISAGSIGQMINSSTEYIYLRGGSAYNILVESKNAVDATNINLRTSSYSISSQTIDLKIGVDQPLVQIDEKIEADDLLPTGIDIKNNQITVTGPTFRVQDNAGTPIAVFTTNAAGKPVLRAENIDVDNLSVKKITGAKGTFNEIKSDDDRMKLYGGGINFRDSRDGITAAFGNEAVSAASGLSTSMYIERNGYAYGGVNISAILSAKGMWCYDTLGLYGNVALSIPYGKIAGLRVYVRRIAKSVTYGTSGIMDNWLIVTASGVTITLPNMTDEMDGHIIVISNRSNGNVTINGPGYDGDSRILGINRHMLGIFTRTEYKWDYSLLD